jgi:O-antigen/teichoic acid export membrane protein
MVSLVSTKTQTGYFGASFRVMEVLAVVPQLLVGAAFPIFARAATSDRARLRYVLERSLEGALLVGLLIAADLVVGARLVIDVVGGSAFTPAVAVLQIQAGTLILIFVNGVMGYAMFTLGMYRSLLAVAATSFAVVLVMSGLLAPGHGAVGGAIATVVGEAAMFTLSVSRLLIAHRDLRPSLVRCARMAIAGAAATTIALLDLPPAAGVAAATAVYVAGVVVLRAIPDEVLEELRRIRRRRAARRARA